MSDDGYVDPYDSLLDAAAIDDMRIAPRFQVFCGVDSAWRIASTDYCGRFEVAVFSTDALDDALSACRLLNNAERTLTQ
jgi:hypothetical protein